MCEYLGRTEYLTSILRCQQWGIFKWKATQRKPEA